MINEFQGDFRFLSNFYPVTIEWSHLWNNKTAKSVEHAYQASKAIHEADCDAILACPTAGAAKRKGMDVQLIPAWEDMKVNVMNQLIKIKFAPNTILGERLIVTEEQFLVEGNSWGDRFWGVCNGDGRNILGHLLMERRAFLQSNALYQMVES